MQKAYRQLAWCGALCAALFGGAAQAASFDCNKARAKVEKAICADKELSILDERMAEAYKKRLTAWQGEVADYVRYDQRQFITLMRTAHEGETDDALDCNKAYTECLRKMLRERLAVMEAEVYPLTGVYRRPGGTLLITARDGSFDILLYDKASNQIRSTLKYERPGQADALRKDASGYVLSLIHI